MKIFASILCALLCGCATSRPILFGMYSVPEAKLPEARELGIDFVVGPKSGPYLKSADNAGLKVIHPVMDEPDLHGVSPSEVATLSKKTKRPVYLNLASGYAIEAYRDACDVVMFDWYPVGWMPLETFYSQLRTARLAAGKKPFYAVIQTFDWAKYPNMMPASEAHRKPTVAEVKAMTIWAAMNGAKGIAYYPFDDGHAALEETPELMRAVKESIALARNYDWLFEGPRAWIDYPFRFSNNADKTNAVAETSIAVRAVRNGETFSMVAANTTSREILVHPLMSFDEVADEIRFAPLEVKFLTARSAKK